MSWSRCLGSARICSGIVGTPPRTVTRSCSIRRSASTTSHFLIRISFAPTADVAIRPGIAPVTWNKGMGKSATGGAAGATCDRPKRMFIRSELNSEFLIVAVSARWVTVAPLGRDVVPEVKKIAAIASGNAAGRSASPSGRSAHVAGAPTIASRVSGVAPSIVSISSTAAGTATSARSLNRKRAPQSASMAPISPGRAQPLIGTTMPPARIAPRKQIGHSVRLRISNATRSPGCNPRETSARATVSAARTAPAYVQRSFSKTRNSRSPCARCRAMTSSIVFGPVTQYRTGRPSITAVSTANRGSDAI